MGLLTSYGSSGELYPDDEVCGSCGGVVSILKIVEGVVVEVVDCACNFALAYRLLPTEMS
jgi:hypothetical protein